MKLTTGIDYQPVRSPLSQFVQELPWSLSILLYAQGMQGLWLGCDLTMKKMNMENEKWKLSVSQFSDQPAVLEPRPLLSLFYFLLFHSPKMWKLGHYQVFSFIQQLSHFGPIRPRWCFCAVVKGSFLATLWVKYCIKAVASPQVSFLFCTCTCAETTLDVSAR